MATRIRSRMLEARCATDMLAADGRMHRAVQRLADARAPVLLIGPPGRGKRWLACALHQASGGGALCAIEPVPALADGEDLCELHALLRDSGSGQVLLPSLDRLPRRWQAALVDLLEPPARGLATLDREAMPSGADRGVMRALVDRFLPLVVPPLHQRPEDIGPAASALLVIAAARAGTDVPPMGDIARARLRAYPWPGDCAELERFAERAVATGDVERALRDLTSPASATDWDQACARLERGQAIELDAVCRRVVRQTERGWIERVAAVAGDARRLPELLGMSPAAFSAKLRDLGLPEPGA